MAISAKCQAGSAFLSCPSYVSWLRQLIPLQVRERLPFLKSASNSMQLTSNRPSSATQANGTQPQMPVCAMARRGKLMQMCLGWVLQSGELTDNQGFA